MGGIRASLVVLLAALGLSAPGWSATSVERDQHAQAIAALIAAGMRIPTERQFAEFQAARYPTDDAALDVVLRFLHLDRFLATMPATEQQARAAELKQWREQVSRLQQNMSVNARAVLARGTGTSVELVNAIARVLHPDAPSPLVPLAADKVQHLREQIDRLLTVVEQEFQQALLVVQAHEMADDQAWELPDGSPQQVAVFRSAVERRLTALRPLRNGMLILREVVARGPAFGLDPQPVRERLHRLFAAKPSATKATSLVDLLADWDFVWGEISLVVGDWCGSLLADALIIGAPAARPEEVDRIQRRLMDLDLRQQRDGHFQNELVGTQVRVMTDAMRWRLYRGDPRSLAEARQVWQEAERRAQADPRFTPGHSPLLAADLMRLHVVAARVAHAMGDQDEAERILRHHSANGPTPFDGLVKRWQTWTCGVDKTGVLATRAVAPAEAIAVARAHLDEAKATGDAQAARQRLLQAAAVLRSGILGLSTKRGDDRATADQLAHLYHLYVLTLSRLDMRHHAAIAALSGTDQALHLIERLERQKRPNPWKRIAADGKPAWDDGRITPLRLASDGMVIANQLKARDPGMSGLYLASIDRLRRLDPASPGHDLTRSQIVAMIGEEDYEGALREAEQLLYARPEQDAWVSGVRNRAVPVWAQRLRRSGENAKADEILARLARDNAAMAAKAQTEVMDPDLPPARRQELERALTQIRLAEIEVLSARQDHVAVMERLTGLLGETGGRDAAHTAQVQERLAQAADQWVEAQKPTSGTPLPILREIGTRLDQVRARLQPGDAGTMPIATAKRLALAYHRLRSVLPASSAPGGDAEVKGLIQRVDRGFAESFAQAIDDQTPVGNLLVLGNTWWDLGEHAKAVAPFERAITRITGEEAVAAFTTDARAWLAPSTAVVTTRVEFRERWDAIVAACGGGDGHVLDLRAGLTQLVALRSRIDASRQILGAETHLRLLTAVGEVEAVVRKLVGVTTAHQRLAACYRELGRPEAAIPHLQRLRVLEPDEPAHRLTLVLATLGSATSSRADLEAARTLAAGIRDVRQGTTDKLGYWEASLIVLELSLMLGDQRLVDDALTFMGRNRSDLSRDLIAPPVTGDDRRVRRPLGPAAVVLARRFLDLYGKPGITARPPFRIDEVVDGPVVHPLFVDSGAPTPQARTITTQDDQQVLVYVMEESQPIP